VTDRDGRIRNGVIDLCTQVARLDRSVSRLKAILDAARAEGMSEEEIEEVFFSVARGRPERAQALKRYGKGAEGT
jgi:hypothetical protein